MQASAHAACAAGGLRTSGVTVLHFMAGGGVVAAVGGTQPARATLGEL
jgi:hypothetical protein